LLVAVPSSLFSDLLLTKLKENQIFLLCLVSISSLFLLFRFIFPLNFEKQNKTNQDPSTLFFSLLSFLQANVIMSEFLLFNLPGDYASLFVTNMALELGEEELNSLFGKFGCLYEVQLLSSSSSNEPSETKG
jgi:hypothetical protein